MRTLFCVFALTLGSLVHADGLARVDVGYTSSEIQSGSSTSKDTRQIIEIGGGYLTQKRWLILGQYAQETVNSSSGGSTTTSTRTSYGPGFGWVSNRDVGAYIDAIYYFSSQYAEQGTTLKGSGYQADLGLKIVLSKMAVLAGFSYAHFDYNKTNTGTLSPAIKHTVLAPRLGLQFEF
jgi:hypothetical protein